MSNEYQIAEMQHKGLKESLNNLQEARKNCKCDSERYWILKDIGRVGEQIEYLEERMEALDY